jgi:hypothetical protein
LLENGASRSLNPTPSQPGTSANGRLVPPSPRGRGLDIKFRLVERKRFGDVYVDNGYMRTSVWPKKGAPEQVR